MTLKTAHREKEKPVLTSGVFSSRTNEWATPQQFYDTLDSEFGFDLDVAATPENAKCRKFFTEEQDGLEQDWYKNSKSKAIFCNPPFGGETGKWVEKAYNESQKGCTVVVVIPFRSDTSYLHDFVFNKAHEIRLVRGRLKYNDGDTASPFPSAVIIFKPGAHKTKWTTVDKEGEELGAIVNYKPDITYNNNRTYPNGKKAPDGIEIRFGSLRPTVEVREMLKAHGFQFSEKQTMWYAKDNEKSRELATFLENNTVEADDTQYEKRNFWAKVRSIEFYNKLGNYTEFMVLSEPKRFFRTKKQFESSVTDPRAYILNDLLRFKKFYNKVVGEDGEAEEGEYENEEPETEDSEQEATDAESEEAEESESESGDAKLAEKFYALATGMQKQIDAKLNSAISQQRPTARRMRIAAGMRQEGYRLRDIQTILYCLSTAHNTGTISKYHFLPNTRSRAHVELLLNARNSQGGFEHMDQITRMFTHYKTKLAYLGITNAADWVNAANELASLVEEYRNNFNQESREQQEQAEKIRDLEIQIKTMKIPGFFPTPPHLIEQMIELADLKEDDAILEPSAGKGDILDAIKERFPDTELELDAIEVNSKLRELLEFKGYNVIASDFLSYEDTAYDKILMNPPFENGLDIDHVTHALELLKHGGRLVAIVSEGPFFRKFKKDEAFREMLAEKNAYVSETIRGAFKDAFNSTGVAVRIIAINEDGTYPEIEYEDDEQQEETDMEDSEDTEALELEAQAEIELLKMKLALEKKKKGLNGLDGINEDKLKRLKLKAMVLDFPAVWDFK